MNLGNFHSCRGEYAQALPYFQQFLALAPGLQDLEGEGKVCHNLGYAHYCLGQYRDAVRSEEPLHPIIVAILVHLCRRVSDHVGSVSQVL